VQFAGQRNPLIQYAQAAGQGALNWTVTHRNNERVLKFIWQELDGPKVKAPDHAGFGSSLIERGVPNSTVKREFLSGGQLCTIEFPLKELSAG
jgi:two-component system, chemotaxis family, CheB/CheR fusion protein